MATKKKASTKGGRREGAGRPQLYKGGTLDHSVTIRVNDEQGIAIGDYCRKHKISPPSLVREASLEAIGGGLGLGVDAMKGTGKRAITLAGASNFSVKSTTKQGAAIAKHCKKVPVATWMREVTLKRIGRADLGALAALSELEAAL
jgi:hypothetical protein